MLTSPPNDFLSFPLFDFRIPTTVLLNTKLVPITPKLQIQRGRRKSMGHKLERRKGKQSQVQKFAVRSLSRGSKLKLERILAWIASQGIVFQSRSHKLSAAATADFFFLLLFQNSCQRLSKMPTKNLKKKLSLSLERGLRSIYPTGPITALEL